MSTVLSIEMKDLHSEEKIAMENIDILDKDDVCITQILPYGDLSFDSVSN